VVGKFVQAAQGLPGDGSEPVYTPIPGLRVTFRAVLDDERMRVLRASDPTSILLREFVCQTDHFGYLINGVGQRWQELPATVDPELGFSEWTWEATITSPVGNPTPFRFVLPVYTIAGTERDLATVAHMPATPGRELAEWESVYLRATGTVALVQAAGQSVIEDILDEEAGMSARAVAAATAAAAASSTTAQTAATAAGNSATLAQGSASAAASSAATSATNATRAEVAADSIDTSVIEAEIALKANKTYVDTQDQAQKEYTDSRTVITHTRRTKPAVQTINNATWTQVTWPVDGGTVGITGSETLTPAGGPGVLLFTIELTFAVQGTTGQRVFRLRRGASEIIAQTPQVTPVGTTYPVTMQLVIAVPFAPGDVFVVDCYHSAGTSQTVNVGGAAESNFISIVRLS
jgi:hypothetical protein